MAKKISFLIVIAMVIISLASCGNGASVPLFKIENNNKIDSIIKGDIVAYTEIIEFYNDGNVKYEYYYEAAATGGSYNIVERIGNFTQYLYEGNIYSEKNGNLCFELTSDFSLTYQLATLKFINVSFPLDLGQRYQRFSEKNNDGTTRVVYVADVTPQIAADVYSVELKPEDKIVSEYLIDDNSLILSVKYTIEKNDGSKVDVAKREYEYHKNKLEYFDVLPTNNNLKVTIDISGRQYSFDAPNGVYLGINNNGNNHEYYLDADYQVPFDTYSFGRINDNVTIFVKK